MHPPLLQSNFKHHIFEADFVVSLFFLLVAPVLSNPAELSVNFEEMVDWAVAMADGVGCSVFDG